MPYAYTRSSPLLTPLHFAATAWDTKGGSCNMKRPRTTSCLILAFLTISSLVASQYADQSSLRFVQAVGFRRSRTREVIMLITFQIWRHGDRTPAFKTFPTDHNQLWTWPEGWGELTRVRADLQTLVFVEHPLPFQQGMREHFKLGAYLRQRYIDTGFLSSDYNSSEVSHGLPFKEPP